MERLQKYIARSGIASRRKAEDMIREGKVKVNGEVITEMGHKISGNDIVEIENEVLEVKEKRYFVMNKPRGIISSSNDEKGRKTVISILPPELNNYRLFPVGRLDYDTKGVLLITNDGEFMNTLVGPQSVLPKEYLARVEGEVEKNDIQ
ncbi:MAG: pseudouridine synthase, partial [Bacilli bacterium]|nr:pseudouridine synthase [Bacilli bacterium]